MTPSKAPRFAGALAPLRTFFACLLIAAPAGAEQVIFSEIHYNPPTGKPEFIEIYNNTSTPFDIGNWYFSDGVAFTFPDFDPANTSAHILKQFERILVSDVDEATLRAAYSIPATTRIFGPYTGALSNAGETVILSDKNGVTMCELTYNDSGKWPAAPDGTGHTLTRINPNLTRGEWRNWTSSNFPGGTPGAPRPGEGDQPTTTTQVATTTSVWKYDQDGNDLGTAWREPGYDDSAWPEGPGVFGRDSGDRGIQTAWATGQVTYYLRKEIEWGDPFSSAFIDVEGLVDDGAVLYLNGQEIGRFSMPGGTINYLTGATSHEASSTEVLVSEADISSLLQIGTNLLAVEVHNVTAGSSDIVFGADFNITTTAPEEGSPDSLSISEIHFSAAGRVDWVELYAPGASDIQVSSFTLSSLTDFSDATPLTGSVPGGGYASFDVDFPVEANGNVNLYLAFGSTVIDAQKFDRDHGEESFQSLPVGKEYYGGPGHTRDAPNNPPSRNTDIVINEIMYDAPSDHRNAEFIELYNRGASSIDLSDWSFTDGVSFDFPPGTSIAPGAYLVVAADANCFTAAHGAVAVLGDWSGTLRDGGELIRLEDSNGNLADEVDYLSAGDWPNLADGDGSSMELRHPDMDNNISTAWADSDESQSAPMRNFTYTDIFERSTWQPVSGGQELHAHLVGDSHVIIENVSVKRNNAGSNLVTNPSVMSATSSSAQGWVCQGTHWASFMDAGKLNLIADGHGDNKANRAEVDMGALTVGDSYTLSFDARWVSGKSRVIFQTLDHGFGTSFLLPIPENLGTPGAANSALLASPAPTVTGVIHSPAVPAPTTPVKVSARVASAAALSSVELVHRLDNVSGNAAWNRTPMTDDGTGLFSATVSQYNQQGNIVQFYVEAKSGSASTLQPKYGPARPAMWIADGRTMPDKLMQERFIMSLYDRQALVVNSGNGATYNYNFPRMSNHFFNATFIVNESEIFYNAEIRKSGSPFTRDSGSSLSHGKWKLPSDRLFRGRRRSVFDPSNNYNDRIARYFLYQLGHPINEMEHVHFVVNNDGFSVRENHEPISNDMLDRNFADGSEGTLLRIDDEWRFNDNGDSAGSRNADWSYKNSDNPVRYHSEWIMRTRESDHDYSTFIDFVRTLRPGNNFDEATITRLANTDMLAINAAVRGYDGDWDTITTNRGKNAYFYRPKDDTSSKFGHGWMLVHWDGDRTFEGGHINDQIIGGLSGIRTYFDKPYIKRRVNYFLTKLLDEHTKDSARTLAWMQAEAAAVAGSGVSMNMGTYTNWFNGRESSARNYVTAAVNNTAFNISTSNGATANNSINLGGTAPPDIYAIQVVGQPGATFQWTSTTAWTLTGVQLHAGANALDVQAVDHDGNLVQSLQFNITKTTNAPPIVSIDTTPKSKNVSLGETLMLDANGSYDPEGGGLSFGWQVTPASGVSLIPNGATATATFTQPGFYTFTATATDEQSQDTARTIGIAVFGPASFSTFGNDTLEGFWDFSNIEKHGNSSSSPHFSLQDNPGRLTINVPLAGQITPNAAVQYIDYGDSWSYDDSGANLSATFAQPDFDDSGWPTGNGFLGFGGINSGPPAPGFQTTLGRGIFTYYFRTEFEFSGETVGSKINIDQLVDDGVAYYLNGQEIGRVRLAPGALSSSTPGQSGAPEAIELDAVQASITGALVEGTNVFAAEVHNQSTGSSDLIFGARVSIAEGTGAPAPDDASPAWVRRSLPATEDWLLQTEVKLEKAQFGDFSAGLLIEGVEGGSTVRYGLVFDDGERVAATRGGASGSPVTLASVPAIAADIVTVRIQRVGNQLLFSWEVGGGFTQIHQASLPANTTFGTGGVFATTTSELQTVEASFDYLMLVDSTPASTIPLVVSEIMYHPASTSALEFIELYNAGATPIDLTGFKTVATEPFDEFIFPAFTLQPGAYGLLVANQASFLTAYPNVPAAQIIGQWPGGVLKDSGELITITDASGALVTSFSYSDQTPWPTTPDGDGPSLVINDENAGLDPNLGTNWRASAASGGSPGSADSAGPNFNDWMSDNGFVDPQAEYAGSGLSNLLAYALGRDFSTDVAPVLDLGNGFVAFSYRQRIGDSTLVYSVESTTDLAAWINASDLVPSGAPTPNGDGTQTVELVGTIPAAGAADTFYRLRVSAPD